MTDPKVALGPFDGLPAFQPLPDSMAPNMKAALVELRKALTDPPSLGGQWPFANPPRLQAALAAQAKGRPPKVQPNQVVRLHRFVRLGDSISVACKKAGLSRQTAQRILSGQCGIAHHAAVSAAGVDLPPWHKAPGCPDGAQKAAKGLSAADQAQGATCVPAAADDAAGGPVSKTRITT